jgi:DNA-binding response OmpR family regulator
MNILVIDDDPMLVKLLDYRLRHRGYTVLAAEDGETGLSLARERTPSLIVLDGMLPGIGGFDVLRTLRESPETAPIPVIMLTARGQEQDVLTGLKLGAEDYIVKPFIPDELLLRIDRVLANANRNS